MAHAHDVQLVPEILAECGVRLVIVEGLPGAKIDGVCIWLDPRTPIIAMSFRFDRIDNFWFVLWHEIAHVLNRHGREESAWIVDVDLVGERASASSAALPAQERETNWAAADNCVPTQEMISFVSRRKFFAERDIVALANRVRVHPGIVVGQIHSMTGRYELLRRLQVKVREYIMPTATVDGWGHVAPVSI
jgi:HTH-type transcriptional regulator / antitoxin HigA